MKNNNKHWICAHYIGKTAQEICVKDRVGGREFIVMGYNGNNGNDNDMNKQNTMFHHGIRFQLPEYMFSKNPENTMFRLGCHLLPLDFINFKDFCYYREYCHENNSDDEDDYYQLSRVESVVSVVDFSGNVAIYSTATLS